MSATARKLILPEHWPDGCNVLVVGCGGTGSEIIDAICRLDHVLTKTGHEGLRVTLQDGDKVSASNVGRQRFLECDIGANKASTLAKRYGFLLGTPLRPIETFLSKANLQEFAKFDLVITAVDRATVRVRIADAWKSKTAGPLWLDCGNGAHTGQVVMGHLAGRQRDRLPHVLDLFPKIRGMRDDAEPSCSVADAVRLQNLGVNRFMADTAIFTILAPLFMRGQIEHHGATIDMAKPVVSPLRIDPKAWEFYGYRASRETGATTRTRQSPKGAPTQ